MTSFEIKADIAKLLNLIEQWENEDSAYSSNTIIDVAYSVVEKLATAIRSLKS